jgi:hypothetical protein
MMDSKKRTKLSQGQNSRNFRVRQAILPRKAKITAKTEGKPIALQIGAEKLETAQKIGNSLRIRQNAPSEFSVLGPPKKLTPFLALPMKRAGFVTKCYKTRGN